MTDEPKTTAAAILASARAALLAPKPERRAARRSYPVLEALVGEVLPAIVSEPVRAFRGEALKSATAMVRADTTRRVLAPEKENQAKKLAHRMVQQTKGLTAHKKFQQLIERTVKTLLMTASPEGDLAFRADVNAEVMSDLSLDVMLSPQGLEIAFYTTDSNTRRLLQGYERDLVAHLESKGLRVRSVRYETEPDPHAPPAVPVKR